MARGSQGELFGPEAAKGDSPRKPDKSASKNPAGGGPKGAKEAGGAEETAASQTVEAARAGGAGRAGAGSNQDQVQDSQARTQGSGMGTGARTGKQKSRAKTADTKKKPARKKASPKAGAKSKPKARPKARTKKSPNSLLASLIPSKRWGLIFYGAAALIILILLFLWSQVPDSSYQPSTAFMNGKPPAQGSITYEEPLPSDSTKAAPGLAAVDEALFTALRRAGIPPQDTHLSLAHDKDGEVSLLKAQLPKGVSLQKAGTMMESSLARTKAKGAWRTNGHGREFCVSLAGRITHKVLLEPYRPLKAPAPLAPSAPPPAPPIAKPQPPAAPSPLGPRLAIIIDDIGYQYGPAKKLISLGLPLTLSILPHSPHGSKIASLARQHGLEVMLHLPMEPRAYPKLKPGPGALLTSMTPEELRRQTLDDLASVPGAKGANNHMGSRFTEHGEALRPVLQVLAEKNMFFIDSITSTKSRAYSLARDMGLTTAQRTIFLDHDHSLPAVRRQLQRILTMAKHGSQVVAIGHPHESTIQALAEFAPRLKKQVRLVTASQFLGGAAMAAGRREDLEPTGDQLDSQAAKP